MTESALLADNKILCIFSNKALKALSVFQFNLKLNNSHTSRSLKDVLYATYVIMLCKR